MKTPAKSSSSRFFIFRTCVRICWGCEWRQGSQGVGARGLLVQVAGGGGHLAGLEGEVGAACGAGAGHAGVVGAGQARLWPGHGGREVSKMTQKISQLTSLWSQNSARPHIIKQSTALIYWWISLKQEKQKPRRKNASLILLINSPGGCWKITR